MRNARGKNYYVFYVKDGTNNGWDEMISRRELAADVQRTTYKDVGFVGLGSINPRVADNTRSDLRLVNDMMTIREQFDGSIPPPRLNLTKACNAFLKTIAPHISVGCM